MKTNLQFMLVATISSMCQMPSPPTGSGPDENNTFKIYGPDNLVQIKSFLIFNRWGETVYEAYGFTLDDPEHLWWNGTHRNEMMNPAVFAWTIEAEFEDDVFRSYKGDVTLMR